MGTGLLGRLDGGIPGETREPRGGRPRGGAGQVLLSPETLHQPHYKTEVGGLIKPSNRIEYNRVLILCSLLFSSSNAAPTGLLYSVVNIYDISVH